MGMDVVEAGEDLEEDAFDAAAIQTFVVSCFHQLVEITIHVLHTDVELLRYRIKEDIKCRDQVSMDR